MVRNINWTTIRDSLLNAGRLHWGTAQKVRVGMPFAPEVQADGEAFCNFREGAASFYASVFVVAKTHVIFSYFFPLAN